MSPKIPQDKLPEQRIKKRVSPNRMKRLDRIKKNLTRVALPELEKTGSWPGVTICRGKRTRGKHRNNSWPCAFSAKFQLMKEGRPDPPCRFSQCRYRECPQNSFGGDNWRAYRAKVGKGLFCGPRSFSIRIPLDDIRPPLSRYRYGHQKNGVGLYPADSILLLSAPQSV